MKRIILSLLLFISFKIWALSPGDIAITGFNFDNPDEFSFVALTNIPNGEVIYFTDNGWLNTGSFRGGEGTVTWTNNTGAAITCGTEIVIDATNATVNIGSITISGAFALSSSGDQILAYQGTSASPTFIFAINSEGTGWQTNATSANTSAIPTGLTNGTNAIALAETDNAIYNCSVTFNAPSILAAVCNTANWNSSNSTRFTLPPGCGFTCGACTPLTEPTTPPSNLTVSNIQCYQADISWTNGNGNNRIVVVSVAPITGTPTDQTAYTANNNFGSGSTIAPTQYVVYNGSGNNSVVLGLSSNTTYYVAVFEYNGSAPNCDENYLTTLVSTSFTTASNCACPEIKSILVNACSTAEGTDEYIIYQNGNFDTYVDSLSITFPSAGTWCNNGCGANTLLNNATYINQLNTLAGCPGLFVYSDTIPANAQVIVFTGNPPSFTMDFSSQCGAGPFYTIFCNNTNTSGRFANSSNTNRTTTISFSSTCSDTVTFYSSSANTGIDGDYVDFDAAGNPYYKNNPICAVPLPVEYLYFYGKITQNNTILLSWATATEINNDYFVIEHSIDGIHFSSIDKIPGNGSSNYINEYKFSFEGNTGIVNYFRLKQVDFDGKYEYSGIIVVTAKKGNTTQIYFNIATNTVHFSSPLPNGQLFIHDVSGKLIYTKNINQQKHILVKQLSAGIYVITVQHNDQVSHLKIAIP